MPSLEDQGSFEEFAILDNCLMLIIRSAVQLETVESSVAFMTC